MGVTITTTSEQTKFPSAVKWYIDENEHLHVIDDKGKHIGVFARGQWNSAAHDKTSPSITINHSIGFTESAGAAAERTARALKTASL